MRENEESASAYTALFLKFSETSELWLKRLAITLLVGLIFSQAALRIPFFRHLLVSYDKFEGHQVQRQNTP